MHRRAPCVILALILLLAFALRLRGIADESLWSDEVLTHHIAQKPLGELFHDVAKFEQIPPVHHLIVHFWMMVFGDSETSLRFPSLLAGVGAVWVIYVLANRLAGSRAALIAALLLAVSPFHIVYAHEARAYTLLVLAGLLSTLAFVRLVDQPARAREAAYVMLSAVLLYVHLYGGFALAAHQVAFFVFWTSRRKNPPDVKASVLAAPLAEREHAAENRTDLSPSRAPHAGRVKDETRLTVTRWFTISVAIALLFAPYLPTVRQWFKSVGINFWVKKVTWDDVSYAFSVYSGSLTLYVLCIALVVIGTRAIWRDRLRDERAWIVALLLSLLLLPVILPVLYSVLRTPVFSPRYGIIASTSLYILAAAGVTALKPAALRVALVAAVVTLNLFAKPVDPWKAHWREAAEYLAARMQRGDLAIVHIKASTRQYDYYVKRRRPDVNRLGFDSGAAPISLPLTPGRHVWFVIYGVHGPRTPQDVIDRGHWQVLSTKWFPDGIAILELDDTEPDTHATVNQSTSESSQPSE